MGSSEMDKPAKEKEKDSKTTPTSTQVNSFCWSFDDKFEVGQLLTTSCFYVLQEQSSATSAGAANPDWSGFQV